MAVSYLESKGYEIIERNFHSKFGEIDIIAEDGCELVFVEVKYRKNSEYGYPQEAIGHNKKMRMISTAKYYMSKNNISAGRQLRFDAVTICGNKISVLKDIFWLD